MFCVNKLFYLKFKKVQSHFKENELLGMIPKNDTWNRTIVQNQLKCSKIIGLWSLRKHNDRRILKTNILFMIGKINIFGNMKVVKKEVAYFFRIFMNECIKMMFFF